MLIENFFTPSNFLEDRKEIEENDIGRDCVHRVPNNQLKHPFDNVSGQVSRCV